MIKIIIKMSVSMLQRKTGNGRKRQEKTPFSSLKTKWNLRGNPFSLFLLNISQHYFKCSILLPPPFLDTKYHYMVIKTDDELFQVLPP